jgi:hypothetical protein
MRTPPSRDLRCGYEQTANRPCTVISHCDLVHHIAPSRSPHLSSRSSHPASGSALATRRASALQSLRQPTKKSYSTNTCTSKEKHTKPYNTTYIHHNRCKTYVKKEKECEPKKNAKSKHNKKLPSRIIQQNRIKQYGIFTNSIRHKTSKATA